MEQTQLELDDGTIVDVEFIYSAPELGSRETPPIPEIWELNSAVDQDGNDVELTDEEEQEAVEQIQDKDPY